MLDNILSNFDFYQNMLTIVVFILSYFFIFIFLDSVKKSDLIFVSFLYIWHTLFSFIYFIFTLSNPADAKAYYSRSLLISHYDFNLGTQFVTYITHIFSQGLNASYLNVTLIFNAFGSIGLISLYLCFKKILSEFNKIWLVIFLLPSMSFWSAGLGKDSIAFFCICLLLYSIVVKNWNKLLILISFFLMFMIRPHIALVFLTSYVIYFIFRAKVSFLIKILLLPIIFSGVFFSLGIVQEYAGLEEASLNSVSSYVDDRQSSNLGGGSSLDIASMSYPMQIFTYIFRPLPFEAHSAVALLTSLENSVLLFLFIYILFKSKFKFRPFVEGKNLLLLTYVLLTCTILAMTTANLGIATRQKWMFMPVLLYLLIYAYHDYKSNKSKVY